MSEYAPHDLRCPAPEVLVVEDELLIAMELEMILRDNGYRVLGPASSVARALDLLSAGNPDLALLDVHVRGQIVTPVAAMLRSRNIPFCLASAEASPGELGAEALAGIENVGKPIRRARVLDCLAAAMAACAHG